MQTMFKKKNKERRTEWHTLLSPETDYIVMSNDIDAYLCARILESKFGLKVGGFCDYNFLYTNSEITAEKNPVYVDMDVLNGRCFSNHYMPLDNPNAINPNIWCPDMIYTNKYAGSTLLAMMALYDFDFVSMSDEKIILLSVIDGFSSQYAKFNEQFEYWCKFLGLKAIPPVLENSTKKKTNKMEFFNNFITPYKTWLPITYENGKLITEIEIDKINSDFNMCIPDLEKYNFDKIERKFDNLYADNKDEFDKYCNENKIFSSAQVAKDKFKFSIVNE